jgi:hypothetical protein
MNTILQLENYFLSHLRMDFHFPKSEEVEVRNLSLSFDYDTLQHSEEPLRRLLRLRVAISECDPDDQKIGHDIDCEINGQFIVPEELEPEKQEGLLRVNGLSILYSTLRGILGNVTGSFPGERICLPTILPPDVVASIEARKREESSSTATPSTKKATASKTKKKVAKKTAKKKVRKTTK